MRKLFILSFVCMIAAVGCKEKPKSSDKFNANAPVFVDIAIAATQVVDKSVEVNGSVLAAESIELRPEINGRITYLQIPEGKTVQAGTILAKINDADLQAQLEKIKVQLELANINEQRNLQLLKVKGINQSDYDISLQQVKSSKADLAYTQSLIDKTIVKAPFTGQIGLRQVSLGAFINTTSTIATLQKTDKLKIDFTLPEMFESYVKVGKSIKVQGIESGKTKLNASIFAIEPQINTTTRNIKVRAQLQGKMLPGAYVKVYLAENSKKPIIMVPTNVIIPESKSKQVAIVKNGMAQFVDVETGYRTASAVEIVKGINVGDSVIVAGMLFVRQGNKLKVGKTTPIIDITK
ncbi:MAG: efflux RND transporter periplasmic adaptor subunit [Bacteroidetes bacterium]|nr:efflux RND transporter periplasmic adaptor subunit [Bacteroidota bacterium]